MWFWSGFTRDSGLGLHGITISIANGLQEILVYSGFVLRIILLLVQGLFTFWFNLWFNRCLVQTDLIIFIHLYPFISIFSSGYSSDLQESTKKFLKLALKPINLWKVWIYQRGKPESVNWRKDNTMAKRKRTNNGVENTTQKTKDLTTWTSIKTGSKIRCSGRVGSSCSTCGTGRDTLVINPVVSHDRWNDRVVITTKVIYPIISFCCPLYSSLITFHKKQCFETGLTQLWSTI